MKPTPVRRRFVLLVPGLFAVAASGCGLGEYEAKLVEQQRRLERFDRENKDLGGPLELPTVKDEPPPVDVFLRLPKGVQTQPENKETPSPFYQYKGGGSFSNVWVGWSGWAGNEKAAGFRKEVLNRFAPGDVQQDQVPTAPFVGPSLTLTRVSKTEPSRMVLVYFTPGDRVAVVYEVPMEKYRLKPTTDAIGASLNTLAVAPEASKARAEYNKRFSKRK